MINPPNSYPDSGSFDDVLERMTRHIRHDEVDSRILEILQGVFEKELGRENAMLSRPDRVHLFREIVKTVMNDVLGQIDRKK